MDGHIAKPFDLDKVNAVLKKILGRQHISDGFA